MKKTFIILTALVTANTALAQSVTVDVPSGYKVVIVPSSTTVPEAVGVTPASTATATATTMAVPTPVYHARARHVASVAEGMVIEHQYDNHH